MVTLLSSIAWPRFLRSADGVAAVARWTASAEYPDQPAERVTGVSLFTRFENALSLALLNSEGWTWLPAGDALSESRGRILSCGQGAVVLVHGDGLSVSRVRDHKYQVARAMGQGGLSGHWRAFSLLFVFERGCPADMRAEVLRDDPSASLVALTVQAGYVDLVDGGVALRPGEGVPSVGVLQGAVARARGTAPDSEIDDADSYHRALAAEESRKERFFRGIEGTLPWATGLIITICVAMFAWTMVKSGADGPSAAVLWSFGACYGPLVREGEPWRLLAALFLHGGWLHLGANMYSLWIVGPLVEKFFGTLKYLVLFCLSGLAASLATATLSDHLSVGASGALFGLLGAMVGALVRFRREIPVSVRGRLMRGFGIAIVLNLGLGFYLAGSGGVQIDNMAHLGGVLGGVLLGLLVRPGALERPPEAGTMARLARAVAIPAMVVVALLPFAVEAYVAYRVLEAPALWQQTYVYADRGGQFVVKVPLPLRRVEEESVGVAFASSDGVEVSLVSMEVDRPGDLGTLQQQMASALRKDGVEIESQGGEGANGRSWHVVRGRLPRRNLHVEVALTVVGRRVYRLQLLAPSTSSATGHEALRTLMRSLAPR